MAAAQSRFQCHCSNFSLAAMSSYSLCFNEKTKRYDCRQCDNSYKSEQSLRSHVNNYHRGESKKLAASQKVRDYRKRKLAENPNYDREVLAKKKARPSYPDFVARYNAKKIAKKQEDRDSMKEFNCVQCDYVGNCQANLAQHMMAKHPVTEKAKNWVIKHDGVKGYNDVNKNSAPTDIANPSDENFTFFTERVKTMIKAKNDQYDGTINSTSPHWIYIVAGVSEEAKKEKTLGSFLLKNWQNENEMVEIYVGVSPHDRHNYYHTDVNKCLESTLFKNCKPGTGRCAYLVRTIKFDTGFHTNNTKLALAAELQFQLLMSTWNSNAPEKKIKFRKMNKKVNWENRDLLPIDENENDPVLRRIGEAVAYRWGATNLPVLLPHAPEFEFKSEFFTNGELFYQIFDENFVGELIEFPK